MKQVLRYNLDNWVCFFMRVFYWVGGIYGLLELV